MTDPWAKLPAETIVDEASKMISDLGWNLSPSDKITGIELGIKPFVEGQAEAITQTAIATYHYLNDDPKFAAVKFDGHQMVDLTPTTQLVFECCKCGVIHDPETVSFQTLVDSAKMASWTIKFRDAGYDAYCKDHSP